MVCNHVLILSLNRSGQDSEDISPNGMVVKKDLRTENTQLQTL